MKRLILFITNFLFLASAICSDPDTTGINANEASLKRHFEDMYNSLEYSYKDSLNNEIVNLFRETLSMEGSFDYSWSQLNMIGNVKSADNKVRIFTWHVEKNPDEFLYYGFIKLAGGKDSLQTLYFLSDKSEDIENPGNMNLLPGNWYGALYYGMHIFSYRKVNYYVLFGYDHNNPTSDKKLIEVLTISDSHGPQFAGDFRVERMKLKRVIFEYSSNVAMSLRYNTKLRKIVFDHLSPIDPMLSSNRRFYVPDGTYDAFSFNKGAFTLEYDVDARNY